METLDIHAIRATLPHRYPMLLVDRVLELEPGARIRALKNVTINEPFFPGHFPNAPVMPGVLIIEALAQACALLAYRSDPASAGKLFLFAGIDEARFKRQVIPGDALVLEATFDKGMRDVSKYTVRATVDGQLACEGKLMAILRPAPSAG